MHPIMAFTGIVVVFAVFVLAFVVIAVRINKEEFKKKYGIDPNEPQAGKLVIKEYDRIWQEVLVSGYSDKHVKELNDLLKHAKLARIKLEQNKSG